MLLVFSDVSAEMQDDWIKIKHFVQTTWNALQINVIAVLGNLFSHTHMIFNYALMGTFRMFDTHANGGIKLMTVIECTQNAQRVE